MPEEHSTAPGTSSLEGGNPQFRLYVAGSSPQSLRAIRNVKRVCESMMPGRYNLEVVDIYKQPLRAAEDRVIALPTLIKQVPGRVRRIIGDLSEAALLRHGFDS